MAVSDGFRDFVLGQLEPLVPGVRARGMFGGVSLAARSGTFALIDDDVLYLKGDTTNREAFEEAGWPAFRPFGPEGSTMGYFAVPGDLLDVPDDLVPWLDLALEAAGRATRNRRPRRRA